ncbi:MAG: InlB B-repeat-containing protein, partial [Paludibacteraceae bacterium]|nr:InlB B-repeat-containing protein [Paludibacteraceae bacterium]
MTTKQYLQDTKKNKYVLKKPITDTEYDTVTFLDWDGTFLFSEKVEEGHDAKGTEITPTREGYTFIGWSKPITNITADLTVIALYEQNPPTGVENTEYRIQNTDKILRDG